MIIAFQWIELFYMKPYFSIVKACCKTYLADRLSWSLTTISPLSLCNSFVMEESANVDMKGPSAWKAAILTHLEIEGGKHVRFDWSLGCIKPTAPGYRCGINEHTTYRDWSRSKLTKSGESSYCRTAGEQTQESGMKTSAHALRTPHTSSSQRLKHNREGKS